MQKTMTNRERKWQAYRERIAAEESKKAAEEKRIRIQELKEEMRKEIQTIESRKRSLRNKYSMTVENYNKLLAQQGGKCAICRKHQSEFKYPLHVDHDHQTGRVRGLLCCGCNTGLGHFEKFHKEMQTYLNDCNDYTVPCINYNEYTS